MRIQPRKWKLDDSSILKALRWRKPAAVVLDRDLFYEAVPDEWIDKVFAVMALCPQHTFQVLTKRPERMWAYFATGRDRRVARRVVDFALEDKAIMQRMVREIETTWPVIAEGDPEDPDDLLMRVWPLPNVWLGVSVEDQATADERIPILLDTPAAVRWISAEPLLGPVDLTTAPAHGRAGWLCPLTGDHALQPVHANHRGAKIDWVVAGGESGPGSRPMHPDWVRSLRDQCQAAGVPFLFKQWGSCLPCSWDGEDERGDIAYLVDEELCSVDYDDLGRGQIVNKHGRDFVRFSHKNTGRLLDGRTWDEYPEARR